MIMTELIDRDINRTSISLVFDSKTLIALSFQYYIRNLLIFMFRYARPKRDEMGKTYFIFIPIRVNIDN